MRPTLTFLGAARTVTGSNLKQLRERNWVLLPIPPESIHAVVLTHAHIDHSLRASQGLAPIGRALLKLDPFKSLDLRVMKAVRIRRHRLELLVEGFNLTNHVNLRPPIGSPPNAGSNINSTTFLQRTLGA